MALGICIERKPSLALPHLRTFVARVNQPGVPVAVERAIMRMLQMVDLPEPLLGLIAAAAFDRLEGNVPIAIKVYSMTVLVRVARREPDLAPEIRLLIEQQLPFSGPAYKARARHVLKRL